MALAVDIKDGRAPSNEMHCQLQLKKTKVMPLLIVNIAAKGVLSTEHY